MKLSALSLSGIALLLASSEAAAPVHTSLWGKQVCSTAYGTKSILSVPHKTVRTSEVVTVSRPWSTSSITVTTIPTVTIQSGIAKDTTQTVVRTSFFSTALLTTTTRSTKYATRNVTLDTTSTTYVSSTKTTTLIASTSTYTTTDGFVPAQSAVNSVLASSQTIGRRSAAGQSNTVKKVVQSTTKQFATAVTCTAYAGTYFTTHLGQQLKITVTKTGQPKTITTIATVFEVHTITRKTSAILTTYTTKSLKATTTTVNNTIVRSHTTIATHTATVTPTPLGYYYAACGADNLLNYTVLSNSTEKVAIQGFDSNAGTEISRIDSPYDCCVKCVTNPYCAGTWYTTGYCFMQTKNVCPAQKQNVFGKLYYDPNNIQQAGTGKIVSNGLCGQWVYGGAQSE